MKLDKIASNPNFELVEVYGTPNSKHGTPIALNKDGEKIVRHDVYHMPSGMCVAGNLNLARGNDEVTFYKTGCLIRKLQDHVFPTDYPYVETMFVENDGNILFILQDLENLTSMAAKNNGHFLLKFTDKGVKIKRKLISGGALFAELSYDELRLGSKHIIFDNDNFNQVATQSSFGDE